MPDLFFIPDDRSLRSRWDHTRALLWIVAREYREVLNEARTEDHHRAILLQAAADLIGFENDLKRRGISSPVSEFTPSERLVWDAVVPLVQELERWHVPGPWVSTGEIEATLRDRKALEVRFNATLLNVMPDETPDESVCQASIEVLNSL